jgi:hypothetical protein
MADLLTGDVTRVSTLVWKAIRDGVMGEEELERLLRYVVQLTRNGVSTDAQIDCLFDRFGVLFPRDPDADIHARMDRLGSEVAARAEEEL